MHNEGHQRPVHGGGVWRRQHGDVRTVDEEFEFFGRRHHRADRLRLYLRRQVRRLGRVAVRRRSAARPRRSVAGTEKEKKNVPGKTVSFCVLVKKSNCKSFKK